MLGRARWGCGRQGCILAKANAEAVILWHTAAALVHCSTPASECSAGHCSLGWLLQVAGEAVLEQGLNQEAADKAAKELQQIALQACSRSAWLLLLCST